MTKEDKELLLKDLCGRYPYKVLITNGDTTRTLDYLDIAEVAVDKGYRPYLRPMSSMTEEERTEYFLLKHRDNDRDDNIILIDEASAIIDWLNAHHLDYRGLIEKDLALEAPENMYVL